MEIEKGKLKIRDANFDDVLYLLKWWSDGELMASFGFPHGLKKNIEMITREISMNSKYHSRVIMEYDGKRIGEMYFNAVNGIADIEIKICEIDVLNMDLETKFLRVLIEYLFDELNVDLITTHTLLDNEKARYIYEKTGFKIQMIKENDWTDQLGNLRSNVHYELDIDEYNKKRENND